MVKKLAKNTRRKRKSKRGKKKEGVVQQNKQIVNININDIKPKKRKRKRVGKRVTTKERFSRISAPIFHRPMAYDFGRGNRLSDITRIIPKDPVLRNNISNAMKARAVQRQLMIDQIGTTQGEVNETEGGGVSEPNYTEPDYAEEEEEKTEEVEGEDEEKESNTESTDDDSDIDSVIVNDSDDDDPSVSELDMMRDADANTRNQYSIENQILFPVPGSDGVFYNPRTNSRIKSTGRVYLKLIKEGFSPISEK